MSAPDFDAVGRASGSAVRIGLLGCGTVGSAVARVLTESGEALGARVGAPVELARVAVRHPGKARDVTLPDHLFTDDPADVVGDPTIDIVVELIGGIEPARHLILEAVRAKKHVVTANKELLASTGTELLDAADAAGVELLFEASVAGGIPIIRPMKESLAGDKVKRVMGIVNGTTNFILTRMAETGASFAEALSEAAALGYTEVDPSADIEGHDAAAKLAILSSLAFGSYVLAGDVEREGISHITPTDVTAAHELGYEIKLVAVAERSDGKISARVHPGMLPRTHPLASVRNEFNAIFVEAERAGEIMFYGRGAGGAPTASAVVGDLIEAARSVSGSFQGPAYSHYTARAEMTGPDEAKARYYMVLSVQDQPGVLAAVAGVFGDNDVSIASVRQEGFGDEATLVLITHSATESQHERTFSQLSNLQVVESIDSRMRVLGTEEG